MTKNQSAHKVQSGRRNNNQKPTVEWTWERPRLWYDTISYKIFSMQ